MSNKKFSTAEKQGHVEKKPRYLKNTNLSIVRL